jgi:hypothetical protein
MNRAQRRAAQHARPKTDRNELTPARATAWARTIEQVRPYEPGEMVPEFVLIRAAFERLRTGHGTEPDFDLASMALNMALVRAEAIDPALVLIIVQGQQAFARMKARWLRGLPFGFDAQGLQDVPRPLMRLRPSLTPAARSRWRTAYARRTGAYARSRFCNPPNVTEPTHHDYLHLPRRAGTNRCADRRAL